MQQSLMHLYSIGRAADNKKPSSPELEILPIETMGYIDGEITSDRATLRHEGVDYFGESYAVEVETSNTLKAYWMPFGSNRVTPPDIRRGERLTIWRYADVDLYYWSDMGLDGFLRRLENVIYAWSGTADESVKKLTPQNSYYVEVSPLTGHLTVSTSQANGEPFGYKAQFNTKTGSFTVTDTDGNYIELSSTDRRWVIKNKDGSYFKLDKKTMKLFAAESVDIETSKYSLKCDTATVNAKTSITYDTKTITFKATTFNGNIANSTFTGVVRVNGLLTLAGGLSAIGGGGGATATIDIPIVATQESTFNGTTTIQGKQFLSHTHGNGNNGSPTSGVL